MSKDDCFVHHGRFKKILGLTVSDGFFRSDGLWQSIDMSEWVFKNFYSFPVS